MATVTKGLLPADATNVAVYNLVTDKVYKITTVTAFASRFGNQYYKILGVTSFSDLTAQKINLYDVLYKQIKTTEKDYSAEYDIDLLIIKIFPIYKVQNTDTNEICYFPAAMIDGIPDGEVEQYASLTMALNLGLHKSEDIDTIATLGNSLVQTLRDTIAADTEMTQDQKDKALEILEGVIPIILTHKNRWRNATDYAEERRVVTPASGIISVLEQYRTLQQENTDLKAQLQAYQNYLNSQPASTTGGN